LELKNKVESPGFGEKNHETTLLEQAKEIDLLKHELSELGKMIFKLNMKGVYGFCVCV
jgi:hypothetical protein